MTRNTYSPFEEVDGQYISRCGWYVVSSNRFIPISCATLRARAGYSSSDTSRFSGKISRSRGASGVCLCVE